VPHEVMSIGAAERLCVRRPADHTNQYSACYVTSAIMLCRQ